VTQTVIAVTVTTDGSGDADVTADAGGTFGAVGSVHSVFLEAGDLDVGGSVEVRDAKTSEVFLQLVALVPQLAHPRVAAHDNEGEDLAGAYTAPVCFGSVRVVVASGGDTKTGIVYVMIDR
jgi:hypothetical protein